MAKSNCPAEDSAPPQASAGQLTPRFFPLSLSGRLLQVTVAISPSAAKGTSKGGTVFCVHPIGRSPQANAGFRKAGERGASAAKQEFIPSVRYGWTSGRGLAVRFGPASWSALVIEFSPSTAFVNAAFVGGPSGLSKTRKQRSAFSKLPFSAGIWVAEATSE